MTNPPATQYHESWTDKVRRVEAYAARIAAAHKVATERGLR